MRNPDANFTKSGAFVRPQANFRSWISSDPGSKYTPEAGRYHLYVSYACPWAHRTLITRKVKGLEDIVSFISLTRHLLTWLGWRFASLEDKLAGENVGPDPLHPDITKLQELYAKAAPEYDGRWTVPILWDKQTETIVSNESSEIVRMLNTAFDSLLAEAFRQPIVDLYPRDLQSKIDEANEWHYSGINNGVYKAGLAKSQEAYKAAVFKLFESLDRAEQHLSSTSGPYYFGDQLTETDIRLFVTIIRFDPVYVLHFKCNVRDIRNGYPAIHEWLRRLYWGNDAFASTTDFEHIKRHYMESHDFINPLGIVAAGPVPHIMGEDRAASVET
ncbi:hypothetical protein T440DRAFT_407663 [Plenodomus tracheiphilus IPT5]|uniref:GST N-terminal domain-containing protein n=1 Tax=Plenodomus tracheiphilus IPT5 TaxID=1408161 RepID=A0A6A7AU09_9PLEO|nr:hypothetical protein T440DRAFT_407663 [Plenodomus tracheiphilus IPT5]